jgi:hypothetical protein
MSILVDQVFFCHLLSRSLQVPSFVGIKGGLNTIIAGLDNIKSE